MKKDKRKLHKGAPAGSVREEALLIIYQINQRGAYANLALEKALQQSSLSLNDRNLLTELVNGAIRMQKHLDWVLALFLQGGLEKQNHWFLNILRLSAYQLIFMENIPAYACIDEAVSLTSQRVNQTMAGVANAVLRSIASRKETLPYPPVPEPAYLAVYYSHPDWIVDNYLYEYGWDTTKSILEYDNQRPELEFRCNGLKISPGDLVRVLQDEGVVGRISPLIPWGIKIQSLPAPITSLSAYKKGLFYVQNQAAMLAAPLLDPQPGERIVDLCAGVGGKTTHLAESMNNRGIILAFDLYPKKLKLMAQNAARMGISIIRTEAADATRLNYSEEAADRILLDVPCTGLGVLNRRSDARWHKYPQDIPALLDIQRSLLDKAAQMVRKGGLILYSTCSTLKQENQIQVKAFLERHHDFKLESMSGSLSFLPLTAEDRDNAARGMLFMIPGQYGTDGMFYALMRRLVS